MSSISAGGELPPRIPPLSFESTLSSLQSPGGCDYDVSRDELLLRAIDLCDSLTAVLETIRPRRSIMVSERNILKFGPSRVTRTLESKLVERVQLVNERRNNSLAAISRLPDDVLREIFSVPSVEGWNKWGQFSVLVSHVCRRWRKVSIDTPRIWACCRYSSRMHDPMTAYDFLHPPGPMDMQVRHPWYDTKSNDSRSQKDEAFLSRSKATKLDLELSMFEYPEMEAPAVEDYLAARNGRRGDVSLVVNKYSTGSLRNVMARLSRPDSTLELRRLRLASRPLLTQIFDTTMTDLFSNSVPSLHEVSLSNMPLPDAFEPRFELLAACKRLNIHASQESGFTNCRLVMLLTGCPDLEEFRLALDRPIVDSAQPSTPQSRISMTKLHSYAISVGRWGLDIAFGVIKAPILRHLEIQRDVFNTNDERGDFTGTVHEFLQASSASIDSLFAKGLDPTSFESVLRCVPSVKWLAFTKRLSLWEPTNSYQALIRSLTSSARSPAACMCPKLEVISCDLLAVPTLLESLTELTRTRRLAAQSGIQPSVVPISRLELGDWPPSGMPATARHAYQLEHDLAQHMDEFTIGQYKYSKNTRRWEKGACSVQRFMPFASGWRGEAPEVFGRR